MNKLDRVTAIATLGEGFHTSLRKGSDHPASNQAHKAIEEMPNEEWHHVLGFLVDGLDTMGVFLAQNMDEGEQDYVARRAREMVEADHGLSLFDAREEAVAEWDRKRHAAEHKPPLLLEIFNALKARGWTNPTGKGYWQHAQFPGEGFQVEAAMAAQTGLELYGIAEDIKEEFGFNAPRVD